MSRKVDQKVLKEAEEAMRPQHYEFSNAGFADYIKEIKKLAMQKPN